MFRISWSQNSIGKRSTTSAGIVDESFLQYVKNVVPKGIQDLNWKKYSTSFFRVPVQSATIFLQSDGLKNNIYSKLFHTSDNLDVVVNVDAFSREVKQQRIGDQISL